MPILSPQQIFSKGLTFAEYLETMHTLQRQVREQFETIPITDDVIAGFSDAMGNKNVKRILILTEDFCPDSAMNIPIAARLADAIPALDLRIVRRSDYPDFAAQFPAADGRTRIPTLIFLDEDGIVGVWLERSQAANTLLDEFMVNNPRPLREDSEGNVTAEFRAWAKIRLALQIEAYQRNLWRAAIEEWQTILTLND